MLLLLLVLSQNNGEARSVCGKNKNGECICVCVCVCFLFFGSARDLCGLVESPLWRETLGSQSDVSVCERESVCGCVHGVVLAGFHLVALVWGKVRVGLRASKAWRRGCSTACTACVTGMGCQIMGGNRGKHGKAWGVLGVERGWGGP